MRRSSVGAVLTVLVLFQVPSAFAAPIAEWGGPWVVTPSIELSSVTGDTQLKRAFGEDAQENGEILNVGSSFEPLPGTQAWAKVYGRSHAGGCVVFCNNTFANTSIDFERAFRLAGSPSGEWEVTLMGSLVGDFDSHFDIGFFGDTEDFNPQSNVGAVMWISPLSDPATRLLQVSFRPEADQSIVVDSLVDKGVLRDGMYLVHGFLLVDTQVHEVRSDGASGTVIADFFNGNVAGLRVGVDVALRVTEQSIIITSAYQSILHRSPTDEEIASALAYLQAGGTREGLRGRLLARFIPVF